MRRRLRFLMELVMDYNETHESTKAVFRMEADEVMVYVEVEGEVPALMLENYRLKDLTEEAVYGIYKEMKAVTEKSTADDDAPNGQVTEE